MMRHSLWQGFSGLRRRQPVAEDGEYSLNITPLHSSTPSARAGSKDWRNNFASGPESNCSIGDCSLGGDSGYGGLDSSRLTQHKKIKFFYDQVGLGFG